MSRQPFSLSVSVSQSRTSLCYYQCLHAYASFMANWCCGSLIVNREQSLTQGRLTAGLRSADTLPMDEFFERCIQIDFRFDSLIKRLRSRWTKQLFNEAERVGERCCITYFCVTSLFSSCVLIIESPHHRHPC